MSNQRLSPLDASFLYMDTLHAPTQGGVFAVLDGPVDFARYTEDLLRKIRYVDRFRQIAVFSPLNLFHPSWEFDPNFDIANHVHRMELDQPYFEETLRALAAEITKRPLNRARPLWAVYVIYGLPEDRCAVVSVIHHAVTDGVGGVLIAAVLLDTEPSPQFEPWRPSSSGPLPSKIGLVINAARDTVRTLPARTYSMGRELALVIRESRRPEARQRKALRRAFRQTRAVRFPFNAPLSGGYVIAGCAFAMDDIALIRQRCGGTVNDVLLCAIASAIERYAREHGIKTQGAFLRVLVPTNVRREDEYGEFGNFVSIAPVVVPLAGVTALERLQSIIEYTTAMKACRLAHAYSVAIRYSQRTTIPPLAKWVYRIFASLWLQRLRCMLGIPPRFNLVMTNLPGTPAPRYMGGRLITRVHIIAPLLPGMGLSCCALSQNKYLFLTFTGDARTCPDVQRLEDYTVESFGELLGVALDRPSAKAASGN